MAGSSDRIQVLDAPVAHPAKCGICGFTGGTESGARKFVDIGLDIDWYGVVYFCSTCFVSVANSLGYCSPEQTLEFKVIIEDLTGKYQRVEAENARLRAALDALNFLPHSDVSSSEVKEPERKDADPNESGFVEPAAKSGSSNLFEDDGADDLLGLELK